MNLELRNSSPLSLTTRPSPLNLQSLRQIAKMFVLQFNLFRFSKVLIHMGTVVSFQSAEGQTIKISSCFPKMTKQCILLIQNL